MKPRRKIRNYTGDPEFMFTRRFNTPLLGRKKKEFKEWANTPGEDGRLPINDMGAYDMQGYWKEYISKGVNPNDEDNHGPDTFKKPNHPSFSDESKHSSRRWPGGQWQEDGGFRAAKHTRHLYGKNLKRYFEEEGRPEYLIEEKDGGGDVRSHNRKENVVHPFLKEKIEKEYAAKKQLAYERALTGELGAEADFRDAYGVPSHTMRPKSNAPVREGQGTIDYPKNDMRNKNFVNPLMTYASGHIKDPQLKKAMDKIQLAPIEMALPVPLVNQMGKIPSITKAGRKLLRPINKTTKKISSILDNPSEIEAIKHNINLSDDDILKLEGYLKVTHDYDNLTPWQRKKLLDRESYYLKNNNVSVTDRIENDKKLLEYWDNYKKDRVEYFNEPKFRERVEKQFGEMSDKQFENYKTSMLDNLEKRPFIRPDVVQEHAAAHYSPTGNNQFMTNDHYPGHTYYKDNSIDQRIVNHEGRHQLTNAEDAAHYFPSEKEIKDNLVHPDLLKHDPDFLKKFGNTTGEEYFLSPQEFITRLDELKRDLSKVGYDYKTMDLTPEILKKYKGITPKEAISQITGKPRGGTLSEFSPEQHYKFLELVNSSPDKTRDSQRLLRWFKEDFLLNQINNKWGVLPPTAIIGASKLQGQDDNTQHMKTKKLRTGGTALLLPRIRAKRQTGGFVFDDMSEENPPVGMPILPISNKAKVIAEEIYDPGSPSMTLTPGSDPFINAPPPMVAGQKNRKLEKQWKRYRKLVEEMPRTKRIQQTDPARGRMKNDTRFREFGGYSMDMSDNLSMFPSDLVDYYGLGGWLKKNVGNVLKTAAGVGSMFIPGMQGVGAGMIAGGVGGMVAGDQGAEETAEVYRPPVAKANQVYDVPMEMGGNLMQETKRTDYEGPSHDQGGIPLGDIGVEVEGEESRTGDMIHSDKIKLTKNMYKRYGGMVPLKKSDIGKSVAQILKKNDKKFEKRAGDKWNDEARKATQEPFEMMSDELSQIYAIAQDSVQEMRGGGKVDLEFVRGTKKSGYRLPDGFHLKDKENFEMASDFLSDDGAYEGQSPIAQFEDYRNLIREAKAKGDTTQVHNVLKKLQDWNVEYTEDPGVPKEKFFPPLKKKYGGKTVEAEGGFDLGSFFSKENLPGNMPIIGSALGAVTSMLRKPEKVKYEQARISPTKVTPISTEGGVNRIRRTFGNTRERMRRMNPRAYMNTMRNMGAAEADAIGDYSGQVTAQNTMMQNQASMQDSQAQTRVNMYNSELAAKEAEANAANRGAKRSTTDAYLNNMFTQFGQKSRDDRSYAAQDKYMDMMSKHLEGVRGIYGAGQEVDNVGSLDMETLKILDDLDFDTNANILKELYSYKPTRPTKLGLNRYGGKLRRLYGGRLRRLNKLAV